MARPRSAGYDGHREQILAAAAELFARQGYAGASMSTLAQACGVSKATLYHYVRDKSELVAQIAAAHVARLEALVAAVKAEGLAPPAHLAALIERFTAAYASAQNEHRVLTEDVKFLGELEQQQVLEGQRRVVQAFADAVAAVRPDLVDRPTGQGLPKALAMLLFGMINWTFTWFKPQGALSHAALAPIVSELFIGGLVALRAAGAPAPPQQAAAPAGGTRRSARVARVVRTVRERVPA